MWPQLVMFRCSVCRCTHHDVQRGVNQPQRLSGECGNSGHNQQQGWRMGFKGPYFAMLNSANWKCYKFYNAGITFAAPLGLNRVDD